MHTDRVEYQVLGGAMVGYLAVDRHAGADDQPAVLLMHEGGGQDDNVRARADRLAELGYVAFALDYLGGGCPHPLATAQARLSELFDDLAVPANLRWPATTCSSASPASTENALPPSGSASAV